MTYARPSGHFPHFRQWSARMRAASVCTVVSGNGLPLIAMTLGSPSIARIRPTPSASHQDFPRVFRATVNKARTISSSGEARNTVPLFLPPETQDCNIGTTSYKATISRAIINQALTGKLASAAHLTAHRPFSTIASIHTTITARATGAETHSTNAAASISMGHP